MNIHKLTFFAVCLPFRLKLKERQALKGMASGEAMAEQAAMKTGSAAAASSGWLYNRPFDAFFIFGTVLLGLLAGASWFTTPAIFTAGYLLMPTLTSGWIVVNV